MSSESTPVVDEAVLAAIDGEQQDARLAHQRAEASVHSEQLNADTQAQRISELDAVREFLAARLGMPLTEALADAESELAKAAAVVAETQADFERKREWHRDLLGHQRVLEANLAELRTKTDAQQGDR